MYSIPLIPSSVRFLRRGLPLIAGLAFLGTTACAHPITPANQKPAATAFGLGPRTSEHGLYTATLQPSQALRVRRSQKVSVLIGDASGQAVTGALISVDGGMPQHGHGLSTQPRVVASSTDGVYEIEGLRFNMGGWWELALTIQGSRGTDRVIFHLQL